MMERSRKKQAWQKPQRNDTKPRGGETVAKGAIPTSPQRPLNLEPSTQQNSPRSLLDRRRTLEADVGGDIATIIASSEEADLLLEFEDEADEKAVLFAVCSKFLKAKSGYFNTLLAPIFLTGLDIAPKLESLSLNERTTEQRPQLDALPRTVVPFDCAVGSVKSIKPLLTDFFVILHHNSGESPVQKLILANGAKLLVVADYFDAMETVRRALKNTIIVMPRNASTVSVEANEDQLRQRLLYGYHLHRSHEFRNLSAELVLRGSLLWNVNSVARNLSQYTTAAWWDLPDGIEEELRIRRYYILRSINGLVRYVIDLYAAKQSQHMCKLGYDTSLQCDSFQLGEFVKFLARNSMLQCYLNVDEMAPTSDERLERLSFADSNLERLMSKLRAAPAYQINRDHSYCGPRKLIQGAVSFIEHLCLRSEIGVCLGCQNLEVKDQLVSGRPSFQRWEEDDWLAGYEFPRVLNSRTTWDPSGHEGRHAITRNLFTLKDVPWLEVAQKGELLQAGRKDF